MRFGKLGKLVPRIDRRTLMLAKYLDLAALPPAPPSRDWSGGISAWGEMMNDQLGCCTVADPGHQIQAWTADNGQEVTVPDQAILAAYEAIGGYVPGQPNTDQGCAMLDVQNYWRQTGIGGHRTTAFAAVQTTHEAMVQAALNLFGGLSIGLQLPISAQDQAVWDVVPETDGDPGSWGGHAVAVVGYDPNFLTCVTWGALQRMTWAFFEKYCDEAYAVLSADWAAPGKVAPSGFNFAALQADLNLVTR